MGSKIKVRCYFCHKQFMTKRAYLIFNNKVGYNSFCSQKCHYRSKLRGKTLSCGNLECDKKFYRALNNISTFNYCSKSCAAIVNNQKYPKWPVRYCVHKGCENIVKRVGSSYCSIKCGKLGRLKYTKEEIIRIVQDYHKKFGRVPPKREVLEISHKAIHLFGSWNNSILAAKLNPNRSHDDRMYKRVIGKAMDGHKCDSASEILIDNWLHKNRIEHMRNVSYPNTSRLADWAINDGKTFIEYFGLAKDSPRYDRSIKEKVNICRKNNIKLISIYPKDLYPIRHLDKIITKIA